jgi:hypothetical protein
MGYPVRIQPRKIRILCEDLIVDIGPSPVGTFGCPTRCGAWACSSPGSGRGDQTGPKCPGDLGEVVNVETIEAELPTGVCFGV